MTYILLQTINQVNVNVFSVSDAIFEVFRQLCYLQVFMNVKQSIHFNQNQRLAALSSSNLICDAVLL